MYIIGIDPGPVVGLVRLFLGTDRNALPFIVDRDAGQLTPGLLATLLRGFEADAHRPVVALERFVVGPRAGRSTTASAGAVARDVVALVDDWAARRGFECHHRSAAEVKPWATDARLAAAGLLDLTAGMRHARDAARHALFSAVRTGLPDPLSRRGREE